MRPSLYSKVAETRIGVPEEVVVRSLVWTPTSNLPLFNQARDLAGHSRLEDCLLGGLGVTWHRSQTAGFLEDH